MSEQRLSNRQITTLKQLAVCCANGGQATLTRDQREAMQPLWRRGIVETWFRCLPDEGIWMALDRSNLEVATNERGSMTRYAISSPQREPAP